MKRNRISILGILALALALAFSLSQAKADSRQHGVRLITAHLLPYSIMGGAQPGFMVEVVKEIERRLGSERPIEFIPWSRSLRLAMREPDYIIFPLTRTQEREPHYQWTINVAPIEMLFVTLDGKPLSLAQAKGLSRISVQQDTPFEQFLELNGFENLLALTDPGPQHIRLMEIGRTEAWFTAKDLAIYTWNEQKAITPLTFGDVVYRSDVYIATSKKFPTRLASDYQRVFKEMIEDGTLEEIMTAYR